MGVTFALLIGLAYLLGAIPSAYLLVRWVKGVDIRRHGSGNVGASNALTLLPKPLAVPVILYDILKGMIGIGLARGLGLSVAQQVVIGIAAIIGHNWPVFLGFNGGRGLLTTLGVGLLLMPKLTAILTAAALLIGIPLKIMSITTFIAVILLPLGSWFLSGFSGVSERLPVTLGFSAIFFIAVIRRLTAPRSEFAATVSTPELLWNRLIYDRDIRDRETWLTRHTGKETAGKKRD